MVWREATIRSAITLRSRVAGTTSSRRPLVRGTAIREYPNVNAAMDEEGNLHVYKDVHLGVAVDTPKGLFVPVIKNAESLNLAGLAKAIADVAAR
ncbi:MAG TPA: 2-oxo acid dehydrogenase subunit E2, partial [Actinomycetes bacterium]|nr:2-oxo acid dehydrogenase subunit E2 [Actinomycetes bacterium]